MKSKKTESVAETTTAKKRPVHKVSVGLVRIAVWANQTKSGVMHSVTVSRSYRAKDGTWKETASFGGSELQALLEGVIQARAWIGEQGRSQEQQQAQEQNI